MSKKLSDARSSRSEYELRRRFITLRAEHSLEEVDVEAPADREIRELMPEIIKTLGWPEMKGEQVLQYELMTEAGEQVQDSETLSGAGIENSDVLWIRLSPETVENQVGSGIQVDARAASPTTSGPHERRGAPPPPVEASITITKPSLVSSEGIVFELGDPPITIGRASRGFDPDIDLTDLDPEFASSRRHARIDAKKQTLVIVALPTTNGTFVNGIELAPGQGHTLKSGDNVLFGFDGVRLAYFEEGQSLAGSFFK